MLSNRKEEEKEFRRRFAHALDSVLALHGAKNYEVARELHVHGATLGQWRAGKTIPADWLEVARKVETLLGTPGEVLQRMGITPSDTPAALDEINVERTVRLDPRFDDRQRRILLDLITEFTDKQKAK